MQNRLSIFIGGRVDTELLCREPSNGLTIGGPVGQTSELP